MERFFRVEASSGIVLLVAAAVALGWANSPWGDVAERLWRTPIDVTLGGLHVAHTAEWIVNDGLMVLFFFVVGLEIRREIHHGELSEWRRAAIPVVAALGGMLAPAAIDWALAGGPQTRSGWGVPMATDIAFAVGILALLGRRVPAALRVLLLALAVIDDLGAILVIAIFYSSGVEATGLLVAAAGLGAIVGLQRLRVAAKLAYVVPAVVVWAGIAAAGIHPTIAGVLVGLMTPQTPVRPEAESPAEELIDGLHRWVAFAIMPVFALANAGVGLSAGALAGPEWSVATAVAIGLVVGKPLGVLLAIGLALALRVGTLPTGVTARHLIVLGTVAGVGFTMSLFIAQLAFPAAELLAAAKVGVLGGSGVAAVIALGLGALLLPRAEVPGAAITADEAESSTET